MYSKGGGYLLKYLNSDMNSENKDVEQFDTETNKNGFGGKGTKIGNDSETNNKGERQSSFLDSNVQEKFETYLKDIKELGKDLGLDDKIKGEVDLKTDRMNPESVITNDYLKDYIKDVENNPTQHMEFLNTKEVLSDIGVEKKDGLFVDSKGNMLNDYIVTAVNIENILSDNDFKIEKDKDEIVVYKDDKESDRITVNDDITEKEILEQIKDSDTFKDIEREFNIDNGLDGCADFREKLQDIIDKDSNYANLKDLSRNLDDSIDRYKNHTEKLDKLLEDADKQSSFSKRDVFKGYNNLKIMIECQKSGIKYQGEYVTKTDIVMGAFEWVFKTDILETLISRVILACVDQITSKDDLEKFKTNGYVDNDTKDSVEKENVESVDNADNGMTSLSDNDKVEKSDDDLKKNNIDKDSVTIGGTTISKDDVLRNPIDRTTGNEVEIKGKNGEIVSPKEIKVSIHGIDIDKRTIVPSFRQIDKIGDDRKYSALLTDKGQLISKIPVAVDKDGNVKNNFDKASGDKITTGGYVVIDTDKSVYLTDARFKVREVLEKGSSPVEKNSFLEIKTGNLGGSAVESRSIQDITKPDISQEDRIKVNEKFNAAVDKVFDNIGKEFNSEDLKDKIESLNNIKESSNDTEKNEIEQAKDKIENVLDKISHISNESGIDTDKKVEVIRDYNELKNDVSYSDKYQDRIDKDKIEQIRNSDDVDKDKKVSEIIDKQADKLEVSYEDKENLKDLIGEKDISKVLSADFKDEKAKDFAIDNLSYKVRDYIDNTNGDTGKLTDIKEKVDNSIFSDKFSKEVNAKIETYSKYDNEGRLEKTEYYDKNGDVEKVGTYNYDTDGKYVEVVEDRDGNKEISYHYEDKDNFDCKDRVEYFDTSNDTDTPDRIDHYVNNEDDKSFNIEKYNIDKDGTQHLTEIDKYDSNASLNTVEKYDSENKISEIEKYTSSIDGEDIKTNIEKYTYDDDGKINSVEKFNIDKDNTEVYIGKDEYSYNEDGTYEIEHIDNEDNVISVDKFDKYGNLIENDESDNVEREVADWKDIVDSIKEDLQDKIPDDKIDAVIRGLDKNSESIMDKFDNRVDKEKEGLAAKVIVSAMDSIGVDYSKSNKQISNFVSKVPEVIERGMQGKSYTNNQLADNDKLKEALSEYNKDVEVSKNDSVDLKTLENEYNIVIDPMTNEQYFSTDEPEKVADAIVSDYIDKIGTIDANMTFSDVIDKIPCSDGSIKDISPENINDKLDMFAKALGNCVDGKSPDKVALAVNDLAVGIQSVGQAVEKFVNCAEDKVDYVKVNMVVNEVENKIGDTLETIYGNDIDFDSENINDVEIKVTDLLKDVVDMVLPPENMEVREEIFNKIDGLVSADSNEFNDFANKLSELTKDEIMPAVDTAYDNVDIYVDDLTNYEGYIEDVYDDYDFDDNVEHDDNWYENDPFGNYDIDV